MSVSLPSGLLSSVAVNVLFVCPECELCFLDRCQKTVVHIGVRKQRNVVTEKKTLLPNFTIRGPESYRNLMNLQKYDCDEGKEGGGCTNEVCRRLLCVCDAQSQLYGLSNTQLRFYLLSDAYSASKETKGWCFTTRRPEGNIGFLSRMQVWKCLLIRIVRGDNIYYFFFMLTETHLFFQENGKRHNHTHTHMQNTHTNDSYIHIRSEPVVEVNL